jgi:hypothetical protein
MLSWLHLTGGKYGIGPIIYNNCFKIKTFAAIVSNVPSQSLPCKPIAHRHSIMRGDRRPARKVFRWSRWKRRPAVAMIGHFFTVFACANAAHRTYAGGSSVIASAAAQIVAYSSGLKRRLMCLSRFWSSGFLGWPMVFSYCVAIYCADLSRITIGNLHLIAD